MLLLEPQEICDLTGRHRRSLQIAALNFMGVQHRIRPDGSLVVLRAHVEHLLGGTVQSTPRKTAPRLDLVT